MLTPTESKKLGLFLQARMGSTRLPGKVMMDLGGRPALEVLIERVRKTRYGDRLFLLTSDKSIDEVIARLAASKGVPCFRGSENDVLDRFTQAAEHWQIHYILRLTADGPLLSTEALTETIEGYFRHGAPDYYFIDGYPIGLGCVEMMSLPALQRARRETAVEQVYFREHVMTYLTAHPEKFRVVIDPAPVQYHNPRIRLALDEEKDLELLRLVYRKLDGKINLNRVFELFSLEPELSKVNQDVVQKS